MALSIGGAEFRPVIRGCLLRRPIIYELRSINVEKVIVIFFSAGENAVLKKQDRGTRLCMRILFRFWFQSY